MNKIKCFQFALILLLTMVVGITSEYEQFHDYGAEDEAHVEVSEDSEEFNEDMIGYDDRNFQTDFHDQLENYARTKRQSRWLQKRPQNGFFGGARNFLTLIWQFLKKSIESVSPPLNPSELFEFLRETYPLPEGRTEPHDEYDFVIIGSGSAGSVLASRLSEEGRWRVLVIEAGAGESVVTDAPIQAASLMLTDYNWGYRPERTEGVCMAMEEQRCNWPRGKAVGGSSVINYMIYSRGHRLDFDRWAEAGNPGWSYDEVFPYFYKAEMANLPGLENSPNHNANGLLSVEFVQYESPIIAAFLKAARLLGHRVQDYNQGDQNAFSRMQATTLRGKRHSSARAYLVKNKQRPNLDILIRSRVVKINIDRFTKTAKSVEYIRNRKRYTVYARKEIILSAGTIGSPQLLMLSGVGPRDHLTEMNIPVIQDLPVGQTLYDHLSFYGLIFLINRTDAAPSESSVLQKSHFINWWNNGKGPITLIGGLEGIGFIKTKISEEPTDLPDMELIFAPGGITADASRTIQKGVKLTDEFFEEVYGEIIEKTCFSIIPLILRPKSKGFLKLKDSNPFHWPRLYYDYFSDTRDLASFVEAIKYAIKMVETEPFQKFGAKLHDKHYPTCRQFQFGTDEYWECAVRSVATSIHHQTGTCKMGQASNPDAVVSPELKVHGIDRLRVIDASVIPTALGSHINAVAIMIGEKGSDLMKQEWGWYS